MRVDRRRLLRAATVTAAAALTAGAGGTATATSRRFAAQRRALSAGGPGAVHVLWQARTTRPLLALTFDDGPSLRYTPALLDTLEELGAPATFFLVGQAARAHPRLVARIADAGHEIGNHSDTHRNLGTATLEQTRAELSGCHRTVAELTGRAPTLFRPPYGAMSGAVLRVAAELHYDVALWTVALRDSELDTAGNVELVRRRLGPGTVLLAHDAGDEHRAVGLAAVPQIVAQARADGYELATMRDLLSADREAVPAR